MGGEPDRLIVVLDRPIVVALAAVRGPAVVEGVRVPRVEPDRLVDCQGISRMIIEAFVVP